MLKILFLELEPVLLFKERKRTVEMCIFFINRTYASYIDLE